MPRTAVASADRQPKAPTIGKRGKKEVHSTDFQTANHTTITDKTARGDAGREKSNGHRLFGRRLKHQGELIMLDGLETTEDYLAELAFNEDWLTIIINPSTHKNAASIFENWCNGQGAEMLVNGKPLVIKDLPVGKPITVKRKIVEQIIRARVMGVQTIHEEPPIASPRNEIIRTSSQVHSFSILKDDSPRSADWLSMVYDRPI